MGNDATITATIEALVQAWNRRDAMSFARLFTSEADYVTGDGAWVHGNAEIERLVREAPDSKPASIVGALSIRQLEGAATVVFRWSAPGANGMEARGVTTCVLLSRSSQWLIDRLQNADEAGVT